MTVWLNQRLIDQQGLNGDEVRLIEEIHEERENVFALMAACDPDTETGRAMLSSYASEVERIEFRLQAAWKFDQTKLWHSWWFRVPHCYCPKLDNRENIGCDRRIYVSNCPIHGQHTWDIPAKPKEAWHAKLFRWLGWGQ